jgi:DNA (cytosine-5)-methyltransferase 1
MPRSAKRQVRVLDLFCGGGGSSLGAAAAGATPVGGIDIWSLATDAFALNHPGAKVYTKDLTSLRPSVVAKELGRIDMLIASPECTHHSVAKGNKPRSEESKELAFQVIRFARALQPRWLVVENVIQMRAWPQFSEWLNALHRLGYKTITPTLEAEQFGVPQMRRRLFVIADRREAPSLPRPYRKRNATVQWVLSNARRDKWSFNFTPLANGRRAPNTLARAKRAIDELGARSEFVMVYYGSDGAGGFQTLDRPLRTITTLDRFALVRPNCVGHEMRMLQPSELALAMGFPRSFKFPSSATRRDCIKLIGNAVCPPVMGAVVRSLLKNSGVPRELV